MEKSEKEFSPEIELLFLKRNALMSCVIGVLILSAPFVHALVSLVLIALFILSFFRLMISLPSWKYLFWTGNCKDEYFTHLNNRAYKYTVITTFFTCGLLYGLDIESISSKSVALLICAVMSLAYGAPLLYWLRGNNDE